MQIYLDCDGVLADFNKKFREVTGHNPADYDKLYGIKAFWKIVQLNNGFFEDLDLMPDAMELYDAVKHLNPIIITGLPMGAFGKRCSDEKLSWRDKHFPGVEMITCLSVDKKNHMKAHGDILIDDSPKYEPLWTHAGGIWVTHTSAQSSINILLNMNVLGENDVIQNNGRVA